MPTVLEHALLPVRSGQEQAFEVALADALPIIRSMPGCISATVSRCLEAESRYLLLVVWERLEHHDPGFRGSAEYQEWRRLLHHFYEPFPEVLHFADTGI